MPFILKLKWQYNENLGEKSGSTKDVIDVYWNQAERQLSTLQARWCLHALRIYSHAPSYQATLGKSLATYPMPITTSRQNKLPRGHECTCVQQAEILGWSGQVFVHVRLRLSLRQYDYTANLYWLHIHTLKEGGGISLSNFTSSGLGSICIYGEIWTYFFRSVVHWTNSWLLSPRVYIFFLEKILRKNRDIFLMVCLTFISKNKQISIKREAVPCKFS